MRKHWPLWFFLFAFLFTMIGCSALIEDKDTQQTGQPLMEEGQSPTPETAGNPSFFEERSLIQVRHSSGTGSVSTTYDLALGEDGIAFTGEFFLTGDTIEQGPVIVPTETLDTIWALASQYKIEESASFLVDDPEEFGNGDSVSSYTLTLDDQSTIKIYVQSASGMPSNISDFIDQFKTIISQLDKEYFEEGWKSW